MAARIVGDGQGLDPAIFFGRFGKFEDVFYAFATGASARHQLKGEGKFTGTEEGCSENIGSW